MPLSCKRASWLRSDSLSASATSSEVSPVLVAFRLGDRSTRMIEAHYGRLIESMDAEIAERLEGSRFNGDQMGAKRDLAASRSGRHNG
jgi:hypothetical protein